MLEGSYAAPKNGTIDGLKTGFTDEAGYCFVGTAYIQWTTCDNCYFECFRL